MLTVQGTLINGFVQHKDKNIIIHAQVLATEIKIYMTSKFQNKFE